MLFGADDQAGGARQDVEAEEMLLLVGFLWRIETDDSWAARTARMLDLVMEGLIVTETLAT